MYYQLEVFLSSDLADLKEELISVAISEYKCEGVQEYSLNEPRVDEILGERAYSGGDIPEALIDEVTSLEESLETRSLIFFFREDLHIKKFEDLLNENEITYNLTSHDQEDWDKNWRASFQPFSISEKLWIIPQWLKSQFVGDQYLYIYPGQGFGTGQHQTTFLCLKIFLELSLPHKNYTCLDFGCGSGILGIAALKLGAKSLNFCDIDKAALDNTLQNIFYNFQGDDLTSSTVCLREKFDLTKSYDLVFANILLSALVIEKELILNSVSSGGHLIASGLLRDQVDEFLQNYPEFEFLKREDKGDWSAVLLRKK